MAVRLLRRLLVGSLGSRAGIVVVLEGCLGGRLILSLTGWCLLVVSRLRLIVVRAGLGLVVGTILVGGGVFVATLVVGGLVALIATLGLLIVLSGLGSGVVLLLTITTTTAVTRSLLLITILLMITLVIAAATTV
jgi:hypothetical protein